MKMGYLILAGIVVVPSVVLFVVVANVKMKNVPSYDDNEVPLGIGA